jgi:hypothetical protein
MKLPAPEDGVAGSEMVKAGNSIRVQLPEIKNFLFPFINDEPIVIQEVVSLGSPRKTKSPNLDWIFGHQSLFISTV